MLQKFFLVFFVALKDNTRKEWEDSIKKNNKKRLRVPHSLKKYLQISVECVPCHLLEKRGLQRSRQLRERIS